MTTLKEDLQELRELKLTTDRLYQEHKQAKAAFEERQYQVLARMEEEGVSGMKTDDGVRFTKSETIYGQVQDREVFLAWAHEHDDGVIEERERKGEINALVRQHLDDGDPLPPGLGFYTKDYISQTQS